MSLRVLALTRYDSAGASSRVRVYQYLPLLAAAGIHVDVEPLLDDDYITRLYARRATNWLRIARAYAARMWRLRRRPRVDALWIEYELLPWLPWLLERQLLSTGVPYIVDYDDAVFHRYDLAGRLVRALLGRKLDRLMASAACVVAGNEYLAARARAAGARRVEIVPSAVDLRDYPAPAVGGSTPSIPAIDRNQAGESHAGFTVGWLGSPSTTRYVHALADVFSRVAASGPLRVVVVGGSTVEMPGVTLEQRAWSKASEAAEIARFDVGVMPLDDGPWERGKCGYKLIQYMACGKPVVASPVGVNVDLAIPGETGEIASTPAEWVAALERLRADPGRRAREGQCGRALVERRYALQVTAPRIAALLKEIGGGYQLS
jgi:glycosyltransferase involved in cell wall biosynthesis